MFDITQLKKKLLPELQKISEDLQVENYKKYKKIIDLKAIDFGKR